VASQLREAWTIEWHGTVSSPPGFRNENIMVFANNLGGVKDVVRKAADVPESTLVLKANYPSQE
jgi:hypothetical protein